MRNRDLRPAAKANPTIQQAFERFQKYNRLKNLSQGSLDFYAAKGRSFFRFLGIQSSPSIPSQKKQWRIISSKRVQWAKMVVLMCDLKQIYTKLCTSSISVSKAANPPGCVLF